MDLAIPVAGPLARTVIEAGEACGQVDSAVEGSGEEGLAAAASAVGSVASPDRDTRINQASAVGGVYVAAHPTS